MDRDGPGANRGIGNPSNADPRHRLGYTAAEATKALDKYAPYLQGDSVVLLTAAEAVSKPGHVTCDRRCSTGRRDFSTVAIQCSGQCDASARAERQRRSTRFSLRILALTLVTLGVVPNHITDGAGWTLLVAFALGWFAGDLWGYSCPTFAAVYRNIAGRTSLRWNLVLLFTGIIAVLLSVLILTRVSEQDWASALSVVLGWLTGRHYHRCRASFRMYLDRVRMSGEV